jgi:hypothetical protein
LRPLMSAIKPTPQESFSSAGSNRPKLAAVILPLPAASRTARLKVRGPPSAGVCAPLLPASDNV